MAKAIATTGNGAEPTRVVLALGSGGARGYAHIGVINELKRRGFDIVGIAGSSMGALVGGVYAAGKLDEFADWTKTLTQLEMIRLLDVAMAEPGAIRAEKILDRIREILGKTQIEDLPIPYIAVSTDLSNGRSVWFQRGALDSAIRASIAIPGFITPTISNGRILADGGILEPLPVIATTGMDADLVIGVSLNGPASDGEWGGGDGLHPVDELVGRLRRGAERLRAPVNSAIARWAPNLQEPDHEPEPTSTEPRLGRLEVMNRSLELMQAALARYQRAGNPPDILIEVPRNSAKVLEFHRAEELIRLGEKLMADALDAAGVSSVVNA
ncbi:patatin-like phospholipase family protein [Smaragdicoccus niigatensis]|uniref:patatin-like phospholipase family protein n=1 Tax=Smaragdicoccus niigatensis TaxID=359359 RepID=UPI00037F56D3|nr:patatin-like phospholipase family protein [Smaragdicoccus niigatensis]